MISASQAGLRHSTKMLSTGRTIVRNLNQTNRKHSFLVQGRTRNPFKIQHDIRNRPLSSTPSSKPQGAQKKTATSEILPNMALASVLGGFVTFVFLYSMNAVGRGDGNASEGGDPLAQLKAEAQEAREAKDRTGSGRMTPEEIHALESGMVMDGDENDRVVREVAVAAPADIAAIEEEANLKIFRQRQQKEGLDPEPTKKKPWWRFGF